MTSAIWILLAIPLFLLLAWAPALFSMYFEARWLPRQDNKPARRRWP